MQKRTWSECLAAFVQQKVKVSTSRGKLSCSLSTAPCEAGNFRLTDVPSFAVLSAVGAQECAQFPRLERHFCLLVTTALWVGIMTNFTRRRYQHLKTTVSQAKAENSRGITTIHLSIHRLGVTRLYSAAFNEIQNKL